MLLTTTEVFENRTSGKFAPVQKVLGPYQIGGFSCFSDPSWLSWFKTHSSKHDLPTPLEGSAGLAGLLFRPWLWYTGGCGSLSFAGKITGLPGGLG
jgi:hypothetical protein